MNDRQKLLREVSWELAVIFCVSFQHKVLLCHIIMESKVYDFLQKDQHKFKKGLGSEPNYEVPREQYFRFLPVMARYMKMNYELKE